MPLASNLLVYPVALGSAKIHKTTVIRDKNGGLHIKFAIYFVIKILHLKIEKHDYSNKKQKLTLKCQEKSG